MRNNNAEEEARILTALDTLDPAAARELYKKDFLLTWEKSAVALQGILDTAAILRGMRATNLDTGVFSNGLAVSLFRDNSTRTRFSFASAANLLGLAVQDLDETRSQIAHGETVRETATMISFLAEVVGIRDDIFLGAGHEYMVDVGQALDEGYREGALPQRTTVVNLQCDRDHPTQSMADLAHLIEVDCQVDIRVPGQQSLLPNDSQGGSAVQRKRNSARIKERGNVVEQPQRLV